MLTFMSFRVDLATDLDGNSLRVIALRQRLEINLIQSPRWYEDQSAGATEANKTRHGNAAQADR